MPRPLHEQVVVIVGASTGLGRATALEFSRRGASVVLAARGEPELREVEQNIIGMGGKAFVVVTDVAEWDQVQALAQAAVAQFGRIDTWINNAAVAEYATVESSTVEEIERVIQINLMGQIYGMKAVIPHMRQQGGGTIINIASILAEVSAPLLSAYSAAKHGIKGFADSLRLEMKHEKTGIEVTTVMPTSMNTPFFDHARSRLGVNPRPIPPVFDPVITARAIVHAAEHPQRDIVISGPGKMLVWMSHVAPTLTDFYMLQNGRMFKQQRSDMPDDHQDNLYAPLPGSVHGEFSGEMIPVSPFTQLELRPMLKRLSFAAVTALGFAFMRRIR
jgi:short-subunit dehydrogenase